MSNIIQNQAGNMAFFHKKTTKVFESCFYGKEKIIIQEGGSRCVDGNTLVVTDKGEVPISEIKIGDSVKSFNEELKCIEFKEVQDKFIMQNEKPTVKIKLKNGNEIICTDDHLFYFDNKWIAIKDILQEFDLGTLCSNYLGHREIKLSDIESFEYINQDIVYDISVQDNTNYFISAGKEILVHNSGKTWAIMQCLLVHCITQPGIICTVVGQDVPNLKKGPMMDLSRMLQMDPHLKKYIHSINNTDRQYKFNNGSMIEFNSYENAQDAHSGSRDYSFFNEANGIPYAVYQQVAMRTRKQIFIDYNPSAEFWCMTEVYKPKKYDEITGEVCLSEDGSEIREIPKNVVKYVSNYSHNPHVDEGFISFIESMKFKDPEYYKIYGKGLQGSIEGLVFKRIRVIPEWPEQMLAQSKVSYGLDYGFSDDPNAMTRSAAYRLIDEDYKTLNIHPDRNGWKPLNVLIVDELLYSTGMGIDALAKRIIQHNPNSVTWCDVNPLLTSELQNRGCILRQAKKPPGSIKAGIKLMQNYDEIWITARSLNGRKEAKNYKYGKTRDNENELEPIDAHNHFWDATRMAQMNSKYVTETVFADFAF